MQLNNTSEGQGEKGYAHALRKTARGVLPSGENVLSAYSAASPSPPMLRIK